MDFPGAHINYLRSCESSLLISPEHPRNNGNGRSGSSAAAEMLGSRSRGNFVVRCFNSFLSD